jgi:hypothetical protein
MLLSSELNLHRQKANTAFNIISFKIHCVTEGMSFANKSIGNTFSEL